MKQPVTVYCISALLQTNTRLTMYLRCLSLKVYPIFMYKLHCKQTHEYLLYSMKAFLLPLFENTVRLNRKVTNSYIN